MEDVYKDIEMAKKFISGNRETGAEFGKYCTSYLFTTENMAEIDKILAYKGKKVLSVASGGDQYLAALYFGAVSVDLFDINRFAYYITYFKIASVKVLNYKEFIKFFVPYVDVEFNNEFWSLSILEKVISVLPDDVALFWKSVLTYVKNNKYGIFITTTSVFNYFGCVTRGLPFLANESEYNRLKEMLINRSFPNFVETDLSFIKDKFSDKYDILYLSNILECMVRGEFNRRYCIPQSLMNEVEIKKARLVLEQINDLINRDGKVLLGYRSNCFSYKALDYLYTSDDFDRFIIPAKYLPYDDYCVEEADTDLVLTYNYNKKK